MSSVGLLTLAFLTPAAPPASGPHLQRGDELTYTGSISEVVERPGLRFRRTHRLEVRVFALDCREMWTDFAVLTLLRRGEDVVTGVVPGVTGATAEPTPPAARLNLVRVHASGAVRLLTPAAAVPLRLDRDTPERPTPALPLDSFSPFELGMFPHRPADAGRQWTTPAGDPARPSEEWQAKGFDFINAERCEVLLMTQQTPTWKQPRGGETSWQRADAVWISTQDGTARKVHRVIRQRDGIAVNPAVQIEVKYELKDQARRSGRTYTRARQEIELAYTATAELAALLPDAGRLGAKPFEARLVKLDAYLEETDPGTPYREALLAARRLLDAARKGEGAPAIVPTQPAVPRSEAPRAGRPAPDFRAGTFRLSDHHGRPVVLVFFRPGVETTDLALAIANALERRYPERLTVVPLVVFGTTADAVKDRDRLKLAIGVHDGATAGKVYDVQTYPRFVIIDAAGMIRWAFAGVGAETGFLVREQIDRVLGVTAGTAAPPGTTSRLAIPSPAPDPRP